MLPLGELQRRVRDAVLAGDAAPLVPMLAAGQRDGALRMAIHLRHYRTSLVGAVMARFQATAWLIGPARLEAAAVEFVQTSPPTAPCIAEYGGGFPALLGGTPIGAALPYLVSFAALDWQFGRLSVAVDAGPMDPAGVVALTPDDLASTRLVAQEGSSYVRADWPIDELMALYLGDSAPEQLTLAAQPVWLEARGSRGLVRMSRLTEGNWVFRHALAGGLSIGASAERAWQSDADFDPGRALADMFSESLVTGVETPQKDCES